MGRVRPTPVLQCAGVRLRPLTEAECYARCYGGSRTDQVSVLFPRDIEAERERIAIARLELAAARDEDQPAEAA
jgi:hypothetical protein